MRLWIVAALFALAAAPRAFAQAEPPAPPARVGAVSYVSGNLAFHNPGDTQWSAASVNYPVATGGSFWTDAQSRALIQIGPATIAMDGGTEVDVTNLNEATAQLGLPQGRINLTLRQLEPGQSFEIDLPQGAVSLEQPGSYDIDAGNPNQGARVAVFAGSARFVGSGADVTIDSGNVALLSPTNPVSVTTQRAARDAFVEWCDAHEERVAHAAPPRYISAQMTGYNDLAPYGNWQSSPQYGEVWYPSQVPAGWAPYREGHWIWMPPWGWTWVDQEPWGFAPFHYGRWAYVDNRWGWVPGSYVANPVYAPALVAFVGAAALGAVASGPAVGWFPLAPGEPYWPSYTHNTAYIRNVNITNVRNINTIIVNSPGGAAPQQLANASFANRRFATVVPQRVFASADPVAPAVVHVPAATLEKTPIVVHPPEVKPTVARVSVAGPPPHPALTQRPAAAPAGAPSHPGERPAATAAIPPRPGAPGSERTPGETHLEHPAGSATAALPPRAGTAEPTRLPPPKTMPERPPGETHLEHPTGSATAALPPRTGTAEPTRLPPPKTMPERPPSEAQVVRPPAHPQPEPSRRPTSPAVRPAAAHQPAEARVASPPEVRPHPAPIHAAAAAPPPRPEAPRVRQPPVRVAAPAPPHFTAAPHFAAPAVERAPHPAPHPPAMPRPAAAQPHPQPPHAAPAAHPGAKPAPKEHGKPGEEQR